MEAPDPDLRDAVALMQRAAICLESYCARRDADADTSLAIATATYLRTRADRLLPPTDAWPKDDKGNSKVVDLQSWRRKA